MTSRFQKSFSPAALAALNAYRDEVWVDGKYRHMSGLAGVIRSLAEHVVTHPPENWHLISPAHSRQLALHNDLLSLADELDNAP